MTGARARTEGTRTWGALIEAQRRVLERIASGAPLDEILDTLVQLVEEQAGGMRCSVLLADAAQQRLRIAAGPSLSQDYRLAMQPYLRIGPDICACSSAAHLRQAVYTRDVANDPLWKDCADIALRNGLRAVWSTPILSRSDMLLGTFAMSYGEPRLPTEDHIRLIDMATQMARVAIEAKCDDEMLSTVFENAPDGMLITDLAGNLLRVNQAFSALLGFAPSELIGRNLADITPGQDVGALIRNLLALRNREVLNHLKYRGKDGRTFRVRQHSAVRCDKAGDPRHVFSRVEKAIEAGQDPLERLSTRELQVLEFVIAGQTSKEIAGRLHLAPASVDTYRSRIMVKLGLKHLPGLVRFAMERGISAD